MSGIFSKILAPLTSDSGRFYVLAAFLASVFLMGGGSRDDIASLIILRPLTVLFAAYAWTVSKPGDFKRLGLPFYLLIALILLVAVQLIPLPPGLWTSLPGRAIHAELAGLAGFDQPWRPLTLSPSKTLDTLFFLVTPLAAMMVMAVQRSRQLDKLLPVLIGVGLLSAFLGIAQMLGSDRGGLYFYRITNFGFPVGLFSNSNHHGVFLAIMLPMAMVYFARSAAVRRRPDALAAVLLACSVIFFPVMLFTGSRMAFVLGLLSIAAAVFLLYQLIALRRSRHLMSGAVRSRQMMWISAAAFSLIAVVGGIFAARSDLAGEVLNTTTLQESRVELLPKFLEMVWAYFPFGAGFGSFEHVYRQFESAEHLTTSYLNQAHNDWVQILIEAGLPGLLILLAFVGWLLVFIWQSIRASERSLLERMHGWLVVFAIIAFAISSLVDYPLRVPSMAALFAIFCVYPAKFRGRFENR